MTPDTLADRPATSPTLVVEDQASVRQWLTGLVREQLDCPQVLEAGRVDEALALISRGPAPALALVDLNLPDGDGVEVIRALRRLPQPATVVVTTVYDDDQHVFPALAAGAQGYLLKEQGTAALARQLRRILDGEPPLSPSVARRIVEHFAKAAASAWGQEAHGEALTPRETEVLRLIGRGLRTGEVAQLLGLSEHTVARYVKTVYRKLDIGSRAEAALEANRRGLT